MAKKKGFNWKALGIGICCVAVGAGLTVGITKGVEYFQNKDNTEQTEEEDKTQETTPEEDVESTVFSQYANAVESAVG